MTIERICIRKAVLSLRQQRFDYLGGEGTKVIYKCLAADGRYWWPRNSSEVRNLTWKEFGYLMDGLEIDQPKAIKVRDPA